MGFISFSCQPNRYNTCLEISVEPIIKEWDGKGDLVDFAVSMNSHRRQLNASQRAMVGARIKHISEDDAKKRKVSNSPFIDKASNGPIGPLEGQGKSTMKAANLIDSSQGATEWVDRGWNP